MNANVEPHPRCTRWLAHIAATTWMRVEHTGGNCESVRVDFDDRSMCYVNGAEPGSDGCIPYDGEALVVSFYASDACDDFSHDAAVPAGPLADQLRQLNGLLRTWCEGRGTGIAGGDALSAEEEDAIDAHINECAREGAEADARWYEEHGRDI